MLESLTFQEARKSVPKGWRFLVEQAFQVCQGIGIPFAIIESKSLRGGLSMDIAFLATQGTEREKQLVWQYIHALERRSYVTCQFCGGFGIRYNSKGQTYVMCDKCKRREHPTAQPSVRRFL